MEDTPTIIILGLDVEVRVKDLTSVGMAGLCHWGTQKIDLANDLKAEQVLQVLCHEIAHFMFNRTRDADKGATDSEDFAVLSEHWAGIIPQLNLLHFEFREDGTLESVVQLIEVEDLEN